MRSILTVVLAMATASCGLDGAEPPVEETYRQARSVIDETLRSAVPPFPWMPTGPPTVKECSAPYVEATGEFDAHYSVYVEYETAADLDQIVDAVATLWEERGLEVSRFTDSLTVFPNGVDYRLDLEHFDYARRFHLEMETQCLPPAAGDGPPGIGTGEVRDLRGPAGRSGATTSDVARWIEGVMEETAREVGRGELESVPALDPLRCSLEPEHYSAGVDASVSVDDADAALGEVARGWRARGLEVTEAEAGGGPTVVATLGDLALRARAEGESPGALMLHGSTPCLPQS